MLSASKRYCATLRHVTLCDNSLGVAGSPSASASASLTGSGGGGDSAIDALVEFLLRCILLESLAVVRNSVRNEHVPAVQRLLANHRSLVRLSLCWNGIEDAGAMALAKAIEAYSSNLTDVDLRYLPSSTPPASWRLTRYLARVCTRVATTRLVMTCALRSRAA